MSSRFTGELPVLTIPGFEPGSLRAALPTDYAQEWSGPHAVAAAAEPDVPYVPRHSYRMLNTEMSLVWVGASFRLLINRAQILQNGPANVSDRGREWLGKAAQNIGDTHMPGLFAEHPDSGVVWNENNTDYLNVAALHTGVQIARGLETDPRRPGMTPDSAARLVFGEKFKDIHVAVYRRVIRRVLGEDAMPPLDNKL